MLIAGCLALALSWVALWNGYPTFYPDSGTYLECGFLLETPVDRPITYGLFLWTTSVAGLSLWSTIVAQSVLLAVAAIAFVQLFLPKGWLLPILVTVLVSGVSFLSSQVMTDVFTSIMLMCMVLFGFSDRGRVRWLLLYTVCCAMHTSHLPVALLLFPLLLIAVRVSGAISMRAAWGKTWGLLAATVVAYLAINISVVKSMEAFYAAHLAETGDLQEYLLRRCPDANYDLCALKDPIPRSADVFLWDKRGVAHRYPDRDKMEADLGTIIGDMLGDDIARRRILRSTLHSAARQLGTFGISEGNVPFPAGSGVHARIMKYFPHELERFEGMRQNVPEVFLPVVGALNGFYRAAVIASMVILCVCMVLMVRIREWRFVACIAFVVAAYMVNCFVNAGLVVVANRFGAKLVWLAPLLATMGVCWLVARRTKGCLGSVTSHQRSVQR